MNYAVSLLTVFAVLSTLAALGVTAGTLFAFPVATFSAFAVTLIVMTAHFFVLMPDERGCSHPGHDHGAVETSLFREAGEHALRVVALATGPASGTNPLSRVADGINLPPFRTLMSGLLFGAVYPLLLAIPGAACLGRRELAA